MRWCDSGSRARRCCCNQWGAEDTTESNGCYKPSASLLLKTRRHISSGLFSRCFNSFCLFVCLSTLPCQLTFRRPRHWRGKGKEKKGGKIETRIRKTFLLREETNSTYSLRPPVSHYLKTNLLNGKKQRKKKHVYVFSIRGCLATTAKEVSRCCDNFSNCSAMHDPWPGKRGATLNPPPTLDPDRCHIPPPWAPSVSRSPFSILQR